MSPYNTSAISVGTQTLSEYIYNDNNGPLKQMRYGNGNVVDYTYDNFDRITQTAYNNSVKIKYKYDKSGNLYQKQDLFVNITSQYLYDLSGRIQEVRASNGSSISYKFDEYNRVKSYIYTSNGVTNKTQYIYGNASIAGQKVDLLYGVKHNNIQTLSYSYDALCRVDTRTVHTTAPFVTRYSYLDGVDVNSITALVENMRVGEDTYCYAYDALGNIESVSKNGTVIESYTYDSLNQLKTVTNENGVYEYNYDNGGNILSVTLNGEQIKSYAYGNANWKDQLTAYNGQAITYDEIGNPLSYKGNTLSWQNGRQLASITNGQNTINYTYNADGNRTSKTVNGVTTDYYWLDGVLLGQKTGDDYIVYLYDENGIAYGLICNNTYYYYVFNLQGDVIGIIDSNGNKVVEYTYTAWGEVLSITGSQASTIGQLNPIRYRGYYYDGETGLYYVSSRYYDPEIGRFINADSQLNQKDGILGYNMFAYCHNNPIMYSDPTGHSITLACIIIGAVIGAVAGGCAGAYVSKKQTGKVNGWAVAAGSVGGGVVGGLVGWGVGAAITAVGAAATGSAATAAAPVVQQVAEKASTALQTYYPPNDGFSGAVQKITLEAGTLIQRTGDLVGRYIGPAGTPTQMLALPYDKIGQPTTILQVQQSVEVLAGRVAPWFGQIGGGIQYQLGTPLDQLISEGIIKIFGG